MKEKKKISWWVLGIFCMAASLSSAVLIDDFESYDTVAVGSTKLSSQGSAWTTITNPTGTVNVLGVDNQYLTYGYVNANNDSRGAYIGVPAIDNSSMGTLFVRMYAELGGLNHSFGLADRTPGTADFGAYETQFIIGGGATSSTFALQVRNGATAVTLTNTLNRQAWYNVWAVINQATDTFDVYATTGDKLVATEADKLATGMAFRNGTTDDLDIFFAFAGPVAPILRIDDIYLTGGVSLVNPVPVPEPATMAMLGLGGITVLLRRKK